MSLGDAVTGEEVTCVGGDAGLGGLMSLGDNVKVEEVTWVGGDAGGLVSLGDNVTGEEVTWGGEDAGIAPWTGDWAKGEGKVKFGGGVVVPVPSMGEKGGKGDGVKLGGGEAGLEGGGAHQAPQPRCCSWNHEQRNSQQRTSLPLKVETSEQATN